MGQWRDNKRLTDKNNTTGIADVVTTMKSLRSSWAGHNEKNRKGQGNHLVITKIKEEEVDKERDGRTKSSE